MLSDKFYKKAIIIVDNSGADIVLGILPFARYLVSRGCKVVLAANSFPALNDVTAYELPNILERASEMDNQIAAAWKSGALSVMGTGAGGPCIDLSRVDGDFARQTKDADFVVVEGMGRAIHTNHKALFNVDSLKCAVFKVELAASSLGAEMYEAMALFSTNDSD
jgi:type II pantothenate kinase